MQVTRTIQIALSDLISHAFRSLLTALGVIFGVGAVIAMMAISEGAKKAQLADIEALGIDNIVIRSVQPQGGVVTAGNSQYSAFSYGITERDISHIKRVFENIRLVVPVRNTKQPIRKGGVVTDVHCFATVPIFLSFSNSHIAGMRGRFFTERDGELANPVCVVGKAAARTLFTYHDPLGQNLRIGGQIFRVIGVLDNPNESKILEVHLNNQVYIHQRTAASLFGKTVREQKAGGGQTTRVDADFLFVGVSEVADIENTAARLRTYLAEVHKQKDYEVQVPFELLKQKEEMLRRAKIVMVSIAAISLLVGGIGIMNIMMANIYERTKEIGTRRALGARKLDILVQFLSESVLLTSFGGVMGVATGFGLAALVQYQYGMETVVTSLSVIVSLGVSVLVGVGFGTYPAWKAANLDPITALRTE